MKDINRINWVKLKERDYDIALQSFYHSGLNRKHFQGAGVNFFITNMIATGDGKIFFDQNEIDKAKKLSIIYGDTLNTHLKKITEQFMQIAKGYELFLKKCEDVNFKNISTEELKTIYCEFQERNCGLVPYSIAVSEIIEEIVRLQ